MNSSFAFVFPGQGSQQLGMLSTLAPEYPQIEGVFALASETLGYDLWQLSQEGPEDILNQTEFTQPLLLTAGYAIWIVWQTMGGPLPAFLAGHSLGEYTALVCAEALDFPSAIKLVALRGKYMQEAVPKGRGAMAAIIGLDEQVVQNICDVVSQTNERVSPANFNSIGQIVVAGEALAVEQVVKHAKEEGAKLAKVLPVSVPSHCELMKPAAERLADKLEGIAIKPPIIPVVNNVDVRCYSEPEKIRDALVRQLYFPVRWVETIQFLVSQSISLIIESGPGKVLTGLNKRIADNITHIALAQPEAFKEAQISIGEEQWI